MYQGWMSFGGQELVNSARTKAYFDHVGIPGLSLFDVSGCENFNEVLGDKPYTNPFVDQPSWVDPDNPDTWDFFGLYPLSAEGIENSTRTGAPIEKSSDGGFVSSVRKAGREMRFTGILVGRTTAAVQTGMSWLRQVLDGDTCAQTIGCTGNHFCYLAACPEVCEDSPEADSVDDPFGPSVSRLCPRGDPIEWPDQCVIPYERHMLDVTCIEGPVLTEILESSCGNQLWQVEFTLYAGVPTPYGTPRFVTCSSDPPTRPSRVIFDDNCQPDHGPLPLQDPDCLVPLPPRPPLILSSCITDPAQWRRYEYNIPATMVPEWVDTVPIITITTKTADVRQLRIRFYVNPFDGLGPSSIDTSCDFCGEFLISFIPKNSQMVLDGMTRTATVQTADASTAAVHRTTTWTANHLLYGSGGSPMEWPVLGCGIGYTLTIDTVPTSLTNLTICLCLATQE